ncbi:MAG: ubiquitin [marine actinobacterium MedAcidi-G2B]|nr:MAG: ubiquitin [marine actinobacterium MedAcidi-G2B]MAU50267.1 ubiquitin-like protein Pup [Actinomycetota bacterium]MDC0246075.1 ubiquitin-like protein Pup [Acidimicrobiaceae bacterium]|tara:strand:- start:3740 stop:3940 length:201 start_codon:yes stop_codon:yes gene_type:complete
MTEQEKRNRSFSSEPELEEDAEVSSDALKNSERIKGDLDGLLDEIDEVLEANAEEFVKSYIQKGGE